MAIVGYKLKLNGGSLVDHIIDVGSVLSVEVTGLATNEEYGVQVASYDDEGEDSQYSAVVYGTPLGPSVLIDSSGNALLDSEGNALITFN